MADRELKLLIRNRKVLKSVVTREIFDKIPVYNEDATDDEGLEARALYKTLMENAVELKEANNKIADLTADEEIEAEMTAAVTFDLEIKKISSKLELFWVQNVKKEKKGEERSRSRDEVVGATGSDVSSKKSAKLPTLTIASFDGEPLQWQTFIDSFESSVHSREELSDIQKFQYLAGYLTKSAKKCIEGFPLTNANYGQALDLLKERFGNPQLIISAHMTKLMEMKSVGKTSNVAELRNLLDSTESHIRALESQGVNKEHFGAVLIPILQEKIPVDVRLEISRKMGKTNWRLDAYLTWLKTEVEARDNCAVDRIGVRSRDRDSAGSPTTTEALLNMAQGETKKRDRFKKKCCVFCKKEHYSDHCTVVTDLERRVNMVKLNRCCFRCLRQNHMISECKSRNKCFKCKGTDHHTAICTSTMLVADENCSVLLQTARGIAADVGETTHVAVNVLFDSCAQRTYVTERIIKLLSLPPLSKELVTVKAFGKSDKTMSISEYPLCIKTSDNMSVYIKALGVPEICSKLSGQRVDWAKVNHPFVNELKLADYYGSSDDDVDILIGADVYWCLVDGKVERDDESGLVAIKSKLGWLLNGPVTKSDEMTKANECNNVKVNSGLGVPKEKYVTTLMSVCEKCEDDEDLKSNLKVFWDLDTLGIKQNELSTCDYVIEDIKIKEGRYEVGLPLKDNEPILEDNFNIAARQLKSQKRRLEKNPDVLTKYNNIIRQQINSGIVEVVDASMDMVDIGSVTYLPHREVIRNDKASTKLRIVFNASVKGSNGVSLNSCLYKGPNLTPKLYDLLLKFRCQRIAISADIEKAFHQIAVKEEDRNLMRFLWYEDVFSDDPTMLKLRFCRVLFGAACSQFLLNGTVQSLGDKYKFSDPEFWRKVRQHFYIDDLNTGAKSVADGVQVYDKMKSRFQEFGFNLRKWRTNDRELKRIIDKAESTSCSEIIEVGPEEKVLGIKWNCEEDVLKLDVKEIFPEAHNVKPTKRNILKVIAGIYDPIGFLQPLVIKFKILFQKICKAGLQWDDDLTEDLLINWRGILKKMESINEVIVERLYYRSCEIDDPISSANLHGFSDASTAAYGACIYIKIIRMSGECDVRLVTAKSRVVPLNKKYTIPRLELMGNFILSNLMVTVMNALNDEITIDDYFCWSDSQVSLAWINAVEKELKTFVQNRVESIRKATKVEKWYYCATKDNPADLVTRLDGRDISCGNLWWQGPLFLRDFSFKHNYSFKERNERLQMLDEETDNIVEVDNESFYDEVKNVTTAINIVEAPREVQSVAMVINLAKYSDLHKLMRITSYVIRFITNLKNSAKKLPLILKNYVTIPEIRGAKKIWIKDNQNWLKEDGKYFQTKKSLNIQEDEKGILRSNTRIMNANMSYNSRAPIVLSRKHGLTELIVWDAHKLVRHLFTRQTLAEVRANYWITNGKSYVGAILRKCTICRRYNGRPYVYPDPPNLPSVRLRDDFPFSGIGVDYLGPLFCKNVYDRKDDMYKCYVVLYTCASTRGMVLDLVHNAEAKVFINSFSRFISRRGCPVKVISDNGSIFTSEETQKFANSRNIEWKFNLEKAPQQGGFFERLVQSVKRCMKKTLGKSKLSYDELQTVLLDIEHILNSRPLCHLFDSDDDDILTPNHIMFGRKLNIVNASIDIDTNLNEEEDIAEAYVTKRFKYMRFLITHFWERWRKDYVLALRERQRYIKKQSGAIPSIDDIVIVYDEKQPRQQWLLGRIIGLLDGSDGNIRGAKVKLGRTKNVIKRSVDQLYPIEFSSERADATRDAQCDDRIITNTDDGTTSRNDAAQVDISQVDDEPEVNVRILRTKRKAAILSALKTRYIISS